MNKPKIKLQSSYYPPEWQTATYNDLATLHAGRSAKSFAERMMSAMKEISNQ